MKKLLLASCAIAGLGLAGCANVDSFVQNQVIDPLASMISNPATQLVALTVSRDTVALACMVAAGTRIAGSIESTPAFQSAAYLEGPNLRINVTSAATCNSLQGVLNGQIPVAVGATVLQ